MDPGTTVGLAASIVTFVDFALRLLGTGSEIAKSASGATEQNNELDKVYGIFESFISKLEPTHHELLIHYGNHSFNASSLVTATVNEKLKHHETALQTLAAECKIVCNSILEALERLKIKKNAPFRCLRSLRAAFKTVLATKKIVELDERLKRFQMLISLHFFPLLEAQLSFNSDMLLRLRDDQHRLDLEYKNRFHDLRKRLDAIVHNIMAIPSKTIESLNQGIGSATQTYEELGRPDKAYPTDLSGLEHILSDLTLTKQDVVTVMAEQKILESLNFESRPYRHENIAKAHRSTFEWILSCCPTTTGTHSDRSTEKQLRLLQWLKTGRGTFWIFGKAGSGKSTLMKFVASHEIAEDALREWGGPKEVHIVAHYFWSAGTPMQKCLKGLLQELLYDILRKCPAITAQVFPRRWKGASSLEFGLFPSWPVKELLEGLQILAQHSSLPFKCCFFIDGLDEYDGDHYELCQLLTSLSDSENFKFCLSSRPWNVFEDAFARDYSKKMCIHELTSQDIKSYTESYLTNNARWRHTCITDEQSRQLIDDIAQRAQGVFLWVFLVVRSLRDGLVNGDKLDDLQKRLEALPTDLEMVFKHMLDHVEPFYHRYMAETFEFAIQAKEPLHLLVYMAREYEEQDGEYGLKKDIDMGMISARLPYRLKKPCQKRINARCGGLIGVETRRAEFIHRTVRDFLLTEPMQAYMKEKMTPKYQANLSIMKALVFLIRCLLPAENSLENASNMVSLWKTLLLHAEDSMQADESITVSIMGSMCDIFRGYSGTNATSIGGSIFDILSQAKRGTVDTDIDAARHLLRHGVENHAETPHGKDDQYQMFLLTSGITQYVVAKMRNELKLLNTREPAPFVLLKSTCQWSQHHTDTLADLLNAGCNPNEMTNFGLSVWHSFLSKYIRKGNSYDMPLYIREGNVSIFSVFLQNRAYYTRRFEIQEAGPYGRLFLKQNAFPFTHLVINSFRYGHVSIQTWFDIFLGRRQEQVRLQLEDVLYHLGEQLQQASFSYWRPDANNYEGKSEKLRQLISKCHEHGVSAISLESDINKYFPRVFRKPLVKLVRESRKHGRESDTSSSDTSSSTFGDRPFERPHPAKKAKLEQSSESGRADNGDKERVVIVID